MVTRSARSRASRRRWRVQVRRLHRAVMNPRIDQSAASPPLSSQPAAPVGLTRPIESVFPAVTETLDRIADALLSAHTYAREDGDSATRVLIEAALLHIGRRLARREAALAEPCL